MHHQLGIIGVAGGPQRGREHWQTLLDGSMDVVFAILSSRSSAPCSLFGCFL